MQQDYRDHPNYDTYKDRGMTEAQIKSQIETDIERMEMEVEDNASIQATMDAEERMRGNND